jgi:hypothetical protein
MLKLGEILLDNREHLARLKIITWTLIDRKRQGGFLLLQALGRPELGKNANLIFGTKNLDCRRLASGFSLSLSFRLDPLLRWQHEITNLSFGPLSVRQWDHSCFGSMHGHQRRVIIYLKGLRCFVLHFELPERRLRKDIGKTSYELKSSLCMSGQD